MKIKVSLSLMFLVLFYLLLTTTINSAVILGEGCTPEELSALLQKYNATDMYAVATAQINQANAEIKALEETTGLSSIMLPRIAQLKADWNNKIYITQLEIQNKETVINGICGVNAENRALQQSDILELQNERYRLEEEQRKSTESYQNIINNLKNLNPCPDVNSFVSGNTCQCNNGYVYGEGKCITYTQSCKSVNNNDPNIVGIRDMSGNISCSCVTGYFWNGNQCLVNVVNINIPEKMSESKEILDTASVQNKVLDNVKKEKQTIKNISVPLSPKIKIATSTKLYVIKTSWLGKVWKFIWRF